MILPESPARSTFLLRLLATLSIKFYLFLAYFLSSFLVYFLLVYFLLVGVACSVLKSENVIVFSIVLIKVRSYDFTICEEGLSEHI